MTILRASESVKCPKCGSEVGFQCRSLVNGHKKFAHSERVTAFREALHEAK